MLSNRVLLLQQQQQQSHFVPPSHYAASYYPNYMSPQPIPVSHPPPSSHPPPPVPFSVQQPSVQIRLPTTTTTAPNPTLPFFSPSIANPQQPPPPPSSSNIPSFQFSTSAVAPPSQTKITNTLPPTTTTPTKSVFSNAPAFGMTDIITKPAPPPSSSSSLFPTTTTKSSNEKPLTSSKIFKIFYYIS